jgi:predicted HicB family RNase H-like nuclease
MADKQMEVLRVAQQLFSCETDWVAFYREILGPRGIVRQVFPEREALAKFEQTGTYEIIQGMLTRLREQGPVATNPEEPTRVITVRLPKSLHESLRVEAHECRTSMNKLCISKLLQFIDEERVPAEI